MIECNQYLEHALKDLASLAMLLLDNEVRRGSPHDHHMLLSDPYTDSQRYCMLSSPPRYIPLLSTDSSPPRSPAISDSVTTSGGIKNFFRKRHKSITAAVSSQPATVLTPVHNGPCGGESRSSKNGSPKNGSPTSYTVPPGSKLRNIFGAISSTQQPIRPDLSSMEMRDIVAAEDLQDCETGRRRSGDEVSTRRRKSGDTVSPTVYGSSMSPTVYGSSMSPTMYGSPVPKSVHGPSTPKSVPRNIYRSHDDAVPNFSRSMFQTCRRSISMRDSPIGPSEFVEMYRSRAYSDAHCVLDRTVASQKARQRRFSASPPCVTGSWTGTSAFEPHQLIIWRDQQNGVQVFRLPKTNEEEHVDVQSIDNKDGLMYLRFLKLHTCYDVIPTSTKLVVFDTKLNVKKAFYALVYNGVRAAPLWDTDRQNFVGMLTITDFIKVLVNHHKAKDSDMEDIEEEKIENWTGGESTGGRRGKTMLYIEPECSMLDAVKKLCLHKVHRLPVIDCQTGNVLYILTHKRLLRYVFHFFQYYNLPQPPFMEKTIGELAIGTYDNVAKVEMSTPLIAALELLLTRRISALPVVSSSGHLLGLYSKCNVMDLASEKTYSKLNVNNVEHVMSNRPQGSEKVETCLKSETLGVVIARLVMTEVHRLVVVNSENQVEGVVSLSDVTRFLLTPPTPSDCHNTDDDVMTRSSFN